ncbi:MAG TPA: phosphotransferase [Anaerolineales bacterium]|nr:phosphotransferase [Anaerolineales bacterium]
MEDLTESLHLELPIAWLILTNGEAEPDDNIIVFGFEADRSLPTLVAKIPRSPKNAWMLQTEYDRLQDAWRCLGAQAPLRLPKPLAMLTLDDQPVLVMSYLHGVSLLRTSPSRFWRNNNQIRELFIDSARALREMNEHTATLVSPDDDDLSDFLLKISKFRELFVLSEKEQAALDEIITLQKTQTADFTYKVLLQGDFWHGNIVRGKPHGRLMFLDWQYSRWSRDVSLDVYMFVLAAALAAVPRRMDKERAEDALKTLMQWRTEILPAYLSAYGRPVNYALLPARYGLLLCCIEKAVRSVIDFGSNQYGDSVWRVLFSKLVNMPEGGSFYEGI